LRKKLSIPAPFSLAVSPDTRRIAVGSDPTGYAVFTPKGEELVKGEQPVVGLAFAPDSHLVLMVRPEGEEQLQAHLIDSRGTTKGRWSLGKEGIGAMAISPDSKLLAMASTGRILVWDTGVGRELVYGSGHIGPLWCACVTPDGKQIVTAGRRDPDVLLWDI